MAFVGVDCGPGAPPLRDLSPEERPALYDKVS